MAAAQPEPEAPEPAPVNEAALWRAFDHALNTVNDIDAKMMRRTKRKRQREPGAGEEDDTMERLRVTLRDAQAEMRALGARCRALRRARLAAEEVAQPPIEERWPCGSIQVFRSSNCGGSHAVLFARVLGYTAGEGLNRSIRLEKLTKVSRSGGIGHTVVLPQLGAGGLEGSSAPARAPAPARLRYWLLNTKRLRGELRSSVGAFMWRRVGLYDPAKTYTDFVNPSGY